MTEPFETLRGVLKRAASALKEHGPPFALGGGYALWVHGAPEPVHDVDLLVAEPDVEAAAVTLSKAGFAIERTPEDWLLKAHADGVVVDVLHRLNGVPIAPDVLERAVEHEVLAVRMAVLPAHDVLTGKLRAMSEHYCDFGALLPAVRAVREQVDWPRLRRDVADNDFAVAFLYLTDRLGISS
jgi:hypothetical protein